MKTNKSLGFIGAGAMGAPMAERLIASGYQVSVYDPNPLALKPLVAMGARAATSARDAATGVSTIFACLPSPQVSREVALGEIGIGKNLPDLKIYIEASTIGTSTVKEIAKGLQQQGIALLDAPVSGGPRGARAGTLAAIVAGDRAIYEQSLHIFETIAKKVFYVGADPGLAQMTKLANNMISAAGMAAASEAIILAVKAGVNPTILVDAINSSTGRNTATSDKFPQSVLTRSFNYGGKFSTMYKDVRLCLDEARALDVPMWVGSSVVQLWFQGMLEGRGDDDYTTITKMIEEWTGVIVDGRSS